MNQDLNNSNFHLNNGQLKGLINLAKNELAEEDEAKLTMYEGMNNLVNNQINLHRVLAMHLTSAHQVSMMPPLGPVGMNAVGDIPSTFKTVDPFTNSVLEKIKKQAMVFGCLSNASDDYPALVVKKAKDLLTLKTQTVLFNDIDLRFNNIGILMELLNEEKIDFQHGSFNIQSQILKNGSQPYTKITLYYLNPDFAGNNYGITKSVFSYDFNYTYLGKELRMNVSFGNADGTQVIELPHGLINALDMCISKLYFEYIGNMSEDYILRKKIQEITDAMKETVDVCMEKFAPEDELTHADKLMAISYFMRQHFQYGRTLQLNGQRVASMSTSDIMVSENNESVMFKTEVRGFRQIGETYEKTNLVYEFDHLRESTVVSMLENEDRHVKLFNYWILDSFAKDFKSITGSARELTTLKKFGRTYD